MASVREPFALSGFAYGVVTASIILRPINTVAPVLSGVAQEGQTLSAAVGSWIGAPTSYAVQWFRAVLVGGQPDLVNGLMHGSPISGATALTYNVTSTDVGERLYFEVIATNLNGNSSPAQSNLTAFVTGIGVNALTIGAESLTVGGNVLGV